MGVVYRCLDLRDGPLFRDVSLLLLPVGELTLAGYVAHLEVQCKVPSGGQLRDEEEPEEGKDRGVEENQRKHNAPDEPDGLCNVHFHVWEALVVDADGAVVSAIKCVSEVLNADLQPKKSIQERKVNMLVLVAIVLLAVHQAAQVALDRNRQVGVRLEHIGVDVVPNGVLVQPRGEVPTGNKVEVEAAGKVPQLLVVAKSSVGGVVHHVQQRQSLADAENCSSHHTEHQGQASPEGIGDQEAENQHCSDHHHAPGACPGCLVVQLVFMEVLGNA
mmetsp:Transcript_22796/g.33080  ORF Transcript_22796/g.33080 Transcript_22796/m.33080 type:complete len:274 (+) Transcript_22796:471-1292(+)